MISKFVIYVALTLVAVVGITNYWVLTDSKMLLQQNMESAAQGKLHGIVDLSAYYLRHFELELIAEQVRAVGADEDVTYIRVSDVGNAEYIDGQPGLLNSKRYISDIEFDGELLGSVTLDLDTTKLLEDIDGVRARSILSFTLSVILIGGLVYFFFKLSIASHLEEVRREKEKIDEEHKFITSVIDTSSHMVLVIDRAGRMVLNNKTCTEEIGPGLEDVRGKPVWDFLDITCSDINLKEIFTSSSPLSGSQELEIIVENRCRSTLDSDNKVVEWHFTKLMSSAGDVKYFIGVGMDVTHHHVERAQLKKLAHKDSLTSLPNRLQFQLSLEDAVRREKESGEAFALMYIDLDNFKPINDSLGHDAGDFVLVAVAQRIQNALRSSDVVARLGGDEFAAIITNISEVEHARIGADKLLGSLVQSINYNGTNCRVGASIGIVLCPSDETDIDQLMKNADQAMYQAKQAGKNTYSFFAKTL